MIYKAHYLELFINGQLADIESQESLNLRIDNVLFEPTKTTTKQIEYSYSFSLPATPNNNKIFDHANVLSKPNKFHNRYSAKVYADAELIFDGSLTVRRYKDRKYECNLVNIKVNTLDEIFGDAKLTDIPWLVDFSGATTINSVNNDTTSKYFFPFVSYGVFEKIPYNSDEVANDYTSKFVLDKYNRYWIETFYPSLNTLEHVKRAFEWKGYDVIGTAFNNDNLTGIYESVNLADGQSPDYNLGNPLFGSLKLRTSFKNTSTLNAGMWEQDLNFPYFKVTGAINASQGANEVEYNFSTIDVWNMCDSTNNSNVNVNVLEKSYMYDPDEQLIVIPKSGWYKIRFKASASLDNPSTTFNANQWTTTYKDGDEFTQRNISIRRGFKEGTPLEIQLIRNYDGNIELIKGRKNVKYMTGNPNDTTYTYRGGSYTGGTYVNKVEWDTEFPHECNYRTEAPTKTDGLSVSTAESNAMKQVANESTGGTTTDSTTGTTTGGGHFGGRRVRTSSGNFGGNRGGNFGGNRAWKNIANVKGYMHRNGQLMPYDQAVSPAFICGFSTLGDGTMSVMRNGYSWSKMTSIKNRIFAKVQGLDLFYPDGTTSATSYCQNSYKNSANYATFTDSTMAGEIQCCVWLEKNDLLEIVAVQRDYDGKKYTVNASAELDITAMSERSYELLLGDPNWSYLSETELPTQLNLSNFTNQERDVKDYVASVATAFNLDIIQNGNEIQIDIKDNPTTNKVENVIDIDDRVNTADAETEMIEYPKSMSVQYKIDTEEWGYERTVPQEWIDTDEWEEHGDKGYTVADLSDDSYVTSESNTVTNYSYTYYDNFNWKEVSYTSASGYTETGNEKNIRIPVIEKSQYMADGYGYDDAMKHDGYGLTQRLWYREPVSQEYVYLADWNHETVHLAYPVNSKGGFNLSYKDTERSLLTEYFQLMPLLSSNYVELEVYITPQEYKDLKGGAHIHFDSDIYTVAEIGAYDPSGNSPTTLKLVKFI